MSKQINLYILVMFAVTYLIRALPVTLIRRKIRSGFLRSFLYGLAAGILAAWFGRSLFQVASLCCVVVLVTEFFL